MFILKSQKLIYLTQVITNIQWDLYNSVNFKIIYTKVKNQKYYSITKTGKKLILEVMYLNFQLLVARHDLQNDSN